MRRRTRRAPGSCRDSCGARTRRDLLRLVDIRLGLPGHSDARQCTNLLANPLEVAAIGIAMRIAWRSLVGSPPRSEVGVPTSALNGGPVDRCSLDRGPPDEQSHDTHLLSKGQRSGSLDVTDRGQLDRCASDGTVRLLSAHWLRAQPDSFVLSRRQELPVAAFVSPEEASDLLAAEKVGALSYCWADRAVHDGGVGPDPNGFHTRTIRAFLKSSYGRRRVRVVALMIDYASLYQSDPRGHRTEEENASFKAGLSAMQHIYSSPRVLVLQHKALPCTATRKRYDESGWPMFEQSIATLATEGGGHIFSLDTNARVRVQAGLRRSADEMERFFHSERTHFYGRADRDTVSGMYRALLENVEAYEMATMPKLVSCVDGALTGMDSSGRIADVETSAVGTRDESSGVFLRCSLLVGLPTACVIFCISAFMQPGIDSFVMAAFLFFFTVATILSSRVLRNHLVHVLSGMPKEQRPYALHFSVHRPPLRRQARIPLLRPLHTDA